MKILAFVLSTFLVVSVAAIPPLYFCGSSCCNDDCRCSPKYACDCGNCSHCGEND